MSMNIFCYNVMVPSHVKYLCSLLKRASLFLISILVVRVTPFVFLKKYIFVRFLSDEERLTTAVQYKPQLLND